MSMMFAESTSLEGAGSGAFVDAIGGLATVVLAIVALAGIASTTIVAIAVIVFGVALLIHGGAMLSEYAHVLYPSGRAASAVEFGGSSLSALFLGGATGIVLGVLDLVGIKSDILAAVAVIVFGSALLLSSTSISRLQMLKASATQPELPRTATEILASDMAAGSSAAQALAGLAAIVLGILAVIGIYTGILTMIALLVVGASVLLTGSALTGAVIGFMRPLSQETRTRAVQP
ncbi:MAG TPA: hypothetical protein VHA77_13760 [Xanthobacteraceae bacterium]|nr:hypothetical protein [Xanthobacteraceae bacterium]